MWKEVAFDNMQVYCTEVCVSTVLLFYTDEVWSHACVWYPGFGARYDSKGGKRTTQIGFLRDTR